ncbi:MAG: NADase-type glycan-binding domain-containing protein [Nocardioidaceae bacterium]
MAQRPRNPNSGGLDDLFMAAGERRGEQRTLIMLGVVGLAFAVILAAFFVGRGFAESSELADPAKAPNGSDADSIAQAALGAGLDRPSQQPTPTATASPSPSPEPRPDPVRLTGKHWRGALQPAVVLGGKASCRSPSSVDAGGNRIGYPATNTIDQDPTTAWRCPGNGRGVTLKFNLEGKQRIAAVGLIPGYAKTDPYSGVDRYAENRRIGRVRWTFDSGRWVTQTLRTTPQDSGLQMMRIPPVRSGSVTLTLKGSVPATRNTVAISTARFATPVR